MPFQESSLPNEPDDDEDDVEERRDGGSSGRNCCICGRACDCSWDCAGCWGWDCDCDCDCGCVWRQEVQICLQRWAEIVYVGAIVAACCELVLAGGGFAWFGQWFVWVARVACGWVLSGER